MRRWWRRCGSLGLGRWGGALLYLRWANPIPLGRAWCVFEMGTTLAVGAGLKVIMPPADVAAFKEALLNDFDSLAYKTCTVDVEKATAREASDLANIKRAIEESGGFLKTNQLVFGAMKGWLVEEARAALEAMPAEERHFPLSVSQGSQSCSHPPAKSSMSLRSSIPIVVPAASWTWVMC